MTGQLPVCYLIPGLGADERVFRRLHLTAEKVVLRWLEPASPTESLTAYAARLAAAVPAQEPCWLVGVSFGGILALAVARLRPLAQVVLISSVASPAELPWTAKLARVSGLHRLLPLGLLRQLPWAAKWFFGVSGREHYQLFQAIIRDTDPAFARWAIHQLVHWPGSGNQCPVRIHGSRDYLLPAPAIGVDHLLPGAGHFLIVTHAADVSRILNKLAMPAR